MALSSASSSRAIVSASRPTIAMPRPAKPSAASPSRPASLGAASEPCRLGERVARVGGLAGAQQRVAAGEQGGPGFVLGVGERECVERAVEAVGRVLVGEAVERAAARAEEHLGGAAGVRGLEQVGGDLLEVAVLAEPGERVRGAPVQALRGAGR